MNEDFKNMLLNQKNNDLIIENLVKLYPRYFEEIGKLGFIFKIKDKKDGGKNLFFKNSDGFRHRFNLRIYAVMGGNVFKIEDALVKVLTKHQKFLKRETIKNADFSKFLSEQEYNKIQSIINKEYNKLSAADQKSYSINPRNIFEWARYNEAMKQLNWSYLKNIVFLRNNFQRDKEISLRYFTLRCKFNRIELIPKKELFQELQIKKHLKPTKKYLEELF